MAEIVACEMPVRRESSFWLKALEFEGPVMASTEYVACLADRKATPLVKAFLDIVQETVAQERKR